MTNPVTSPLANGAAEAKAEFYALAGQQLILPDHAEYEDSRGVWNAAVDAHPAAIVRCASADDVVAALRAAPHLPVAVRSGGHSPAGYGTCQGGMVLDLSAMKGLTINQEQRTARLEPGLTWGEVAQALEPLGLAITAGDTATVGVGGLTLGGGIGWMVNQHGLTIDRLRAVELVTAAGERVRASATENPDLFWGLRGGGHNFGVAVAFEFELHSCGLVTGGAVFYETGDLSQLLQRAAQAALSAPEELTMQVMVMEAPPAPFIPDYLKGKPVAAVLLCHNGDPSPGEAAVAPFRKLGTVVADLVGPMPYTVLLSLADAGCARGFRHNCRTLFLRELAPEVTDMLEAEFNGNRSPGLLAQLRVVGGAAHRVPAEDTAFNHRDKPFLLMLNNMTVDPDHDGAAQEHLSEMWEAIGRHSAGNYVNFLGIHEAGEAANSYSPATQHRLAQLKAQWDPENRFRFNGNATAATA